MKGSVLQRQSALCASKAEKEMRGKVDMIAASLFLQSWLDKRMAGSLKGEANES